MGMDGCQLRKFWTVSGTRTLPLQLLYVPIWLVTLHGAKKRKWGIGGVFDTNGRNGELGGAVWSG